MAAAVRRWLGREPGYLLILDNADDPALVKPFLPPTPTGHVLLTSRAHNFDRLNIRRPIALPVLTPDEALAFLGKRTGREGPLDSAEQAAARTLAGELGYLPLALEQAAAYMVEHEEAFSVYLAAYHAVRLKLLDEMGPVAGEYPETVRTTWKRSFDAVAAASPAAIALLRLSAFFAPDAIPYELILEGASELGEPLASALASPAGGEHALNKLLTPLARHSLVRRDPEARTYSVHRLVQAVLLDELTAATRKDLAERAVKALNRTFPDVEYANWPRCERLVPHALAARGWIESEDLRVPEAARLLNQAGYYLYLRARYAEAEPLYRRALAIREAALGPDHPDTAPSLNNLAAAAPAQGRYGEAEPLLPPGAGDPRGGAGPRPPRHGQSLNNLAELLRAQGRYGEAEPLYRRALAIREAALGPDHPDTAQSLNNLAVVLQAQGRLRGGGAAVPPGAGDPRGGAGPRPPRHGPQPQQPGGAAPGPGPVRGGGAAATAGRWRSARRRWAPTTPTRPRASTTWRGCSGPRPARGGGAAVPPGAGDPRGGAGPRPPRHGPEPQQPGGVALRAQGRYGEAEPLYRRALAIREEALGPDHPDTAPSLNNLAELSGPRAGTGRRSRCYRRALAIREKALGPDHPDTAQSLNNLAELLRARAGPARRSRCSAGPWRSARRRRAPTTPTRPQPQQPGGLLRPGRYARRSRCTAGRWRSARRRWAPTTPTRPPASTTWRGCSGTRAGPGRRSRCSAGRWRSARRRWAPTTPTRPQPQQPGEVLYDQGRSAEAEPLRRRALAICETKLGPEHPDTVCAERTSPRSCLG